MARERGVKPSCANCRKEQGNGEKAWKKAACTLYFLFFIRYFLHLHTKCYLQSPLYPTPSLFPNLPTPASWPCHSPVLGHMIFTRPRASPDIDCRLGHPLLYMQLETQFWGYWLIHIVVPPIGLQNPLAPWVLSLAPSLGALCSIQ